MTSCNLEYLVSRGTENGKLYSLRKTRQKKTPNPGEQPLTHRKEVPFEKEEEVAMCVGASPQQVRQETGAVHIWPSQRGTPDLWPCTSGFRQSRCT